MKILFLPRWYPPHGGIFIERHAQAVALYNELVVLAILPGENNSGRKPVIDGPSDHKGFPVIRYFYRSSHCRIAFIAGLINLLKFSTRSFAGYRYVSKHYGPFDILHVHILTRAAVIAFLVNLLTGKPYIITEHWTRYLPENWGFKWIVRRIVTRLIVRRAAAVTTVSDYLKNAMEVCGLRNKHYAIIPNSIDTTLFNIEDRRDTTCRVHDPNPIKRILHVSTFHENSKNISGILRVIRKLSDQRNDFEMVFVGGHGDSRGKAMSYASALGLVSPVVIFQGRLFTTELAETYRGSAFLLMFSNFESFSVVIPEALACGIPVIATAAGGIPEYFSPDAGKLVSPGDEEALLKTINFMLDNYQSYDPQHLASLVESRFGLKKVGKQFDELYSRFAVRI